jgi:hypothetical protein
MQQEILRQRHPPIPNEWGQLAQNVALLLNAVRLPPGEIHMAAALAYIVLDQP